MIRQRAECCWHFDCNPWEEPHFPTEGEALADERAAAVDERAPRPVRRTPAGCWVADCDRCDRPCDDEDIGVLHCPDQRQLTQELDAAGWQVAAGGWLCCPGCAADQTVREHAHQPAEHTDRARGPRGRAES